MYLSKDREIVELIPCKTNDASQRWANILLGTRFFGRAVLPIGTQKNVCVKPKCMFDQDTTRNIVFCFLLPK